MTVEQFNEASIYRKKIDNLKNRISALETSRISHIQLQDGSEIDIRNRGEVKDVIISRFRQEIELLEQKFKNL